MNATPVTSANLESLAEGAKLLPVIAGNDLPTGRRHGLEAHPFCTIEEIHIRAETVTPLLREILDHLPVPHWEING